MIVIAGIAIVIVAVLGLLTMLVLRILENRGVISNRFHISGVEFVMAFLIGSAVVTPTVLKIGHDMSVNAVLIDNEFYDAVENMPTDTPNTCHAGHSELFATDDSAGKSDCTYVYVSGHYDYTVTKKGDCTGSGSNKHCDPDTITTYRANIYTPYAMVEYRFSVTDTLGQEHDYSGTYIATNAQRYSPGVVIPSWIPRGTPPDWQDAMNHWKVGNPRSVTAIRQYPNPILALQKRTGTIEYDILPPADVVQGYVAKHELPDYTQNILTNPIMGGTDAQARTTANKAAFVCVNISSALQQEWQDRLMQFNAQLGEHYQGDLHILVVGSCITDLHQYVLSAKEWDQSSHYGNSPLSKNGIVLVLQTDDGKTIKNADATTGMPFGNNLMLNAIRIDLPGQSIAPRSVLGDPRTIINGKSKQFLPGPQPGSLENLMLYGPYRFSRVCMINCPPGQTGYGNLVAQLGPTAHAEEMMLLVVAGGSLIFWLVVAWTDGTDDVWESLMNRINGNNRRRNSSPYTYR